MTVDTVPTATQFHSLVTEQRYDPSTAVLLAVELAEAVASAHRRGMVDGALHPGRVVLSNGYPIIVDLGVPKSGSGTPAIVDLERTRAAYRSPEQGIGEAFDNRADVFALGVLLYEMLTGTSPFQQPTIAETVMAVLTKTPPPPSTFDPRIPRVLDDVVGRALRKSLEARYPSVDDFLADLRRVARALPAPRSVQAPAPAPAAPVPPAAAAGPSSEQPSAPSRVVRPLRVRPLAMSAAVLIVASGVWLVLSPAIGRDRTAPSPVPLVVLLVPVEFGGAPSQDVLAGRLTDTLARTVRQAPGITLVQSDLREKRDVQEAASLAGASHVLMGAVRQDGAEYFVSLDLVDVTHGKHLWAGQYRSEQRGISEMEAEIASDVRTILASKSVAR